MRFNKNLFKIESKNQYAKKKNKFGVRNAILRALFSHVGLFLVVALYSIGGAFLFINLELPEEEKMIDAKNKAVELLQRGEKYIFDEVNYLIFNKEESRKFKSKVAESLTLYKQSIIKTMKQHKYDGNPDSTWEYSWTISNALLFTVTTIGVIGYGNIYPRTWLGQFLTIYYGMIGIPLLLLFLTNIGDVMASAMRYIYSRLCCRWCRAKRRLAEYRNNQKSVKNRDLLKDEVGVEAYMPTSEVQVPIMVNLAVIAVYLSSGGAFFQYSENWMLHEACYFCFITLTTIGFGDYVPGLSTSKETDYTALASFKFLITIFYCIFGMALLSMSINLMKTQIVENTKWAATEIGLLEEEYDPKERYKIKMACEDNMIITPSGKDGNKHNVLYNAEDDFTLPQKQI